MANRVANVARNGFRNDARPRMILSVSIARSLAGECYVLLLEAVKNVNAKDAPNKFVEVCGCFDNGGEPFRDVHQESKYPSLKKTGK